MDKRKEELLKLRSFTEDIDKDLTMILQSLQWDRKHILQVSKLLLNCFYVLFWDNYCVKYNVSHMG